MFFTPVTALEALVVAEVVAVVADLVVVVGWTMAMSADGIVLELIVASSVSFVMTSTPTSPITSSSFMMVIFRRRQRRDGY